MPGSVWLPAIAVASVLVVLGIAKVGIRKGVLLTAFGAVLILYPLVILQLSGTAVGAQFQPRYLLPVVFLFMGVALAPLDGHEIRLTRPQRLVLTVGAVVASSVALHVELRRYATGVDVLSPFLDAGSEWSYVPMASPMAVWGHRLGGCGRPVRAGAPPAHARLDPVRRSRSRSWRRCHRDRALAGSPARLTRGRRPLGWRRAEESSCVSPWSTASTAPCPPAARTRSVCEQVDLLRSAGHEVLLVGRASDDLGGGALDRLRVARDVAFGKGADPTPRLREFAPDVVHVHNLFPNFATDWLARWPGPLVATVHNFRPVCANAVLIRDGRVCTLCPDGDRWAGVRHGCYRDSRVASIPIAIRNRRGIGHDPLLTRADRVILLSPWAGDLYVRFGLPADTIDVVPNAVAEPARPRRRPGPRMHRVRAAHRREELVGAASRMAVRSAAGHLRLRAALG